jgi:hypothetical protein
MTRKLLELNRFDSPCLQSLFVTAEQGIRQTDNFELVINLNLEADRRAIPQKVLARRKA